MIAVGNLIISGLPAGPPDRDTRDMLEAAGFGGFLLLRRNIGVPDDVVRLVEELPRRASVPPIIAIDEEGGMVSRLEHLGLRGPSALAVAATGDVSAARLTARLSGRVLRALGVNVVLGPCLDVLSEPRNPVIATRAFGSDPEQVTVFGGQAVQGYREAGLAPVIKHFPGHGATSADSHVDQPSVDGDLDTMRRRELHPFRIAVSDGADAIMTAHVRYPQATPAPDAALPATLSRFWIEDILRGELGFDGIVMSDAMEMEGVAGGTRLENALVDGLRAGVDLFIFEDLENAMRARGHLLAVADAGGPLAERLAQAVMRARRWREGLAAGSSGESPTRSLLAVAGELEQVHRRAVALVGDPGGTLPLATQTPLLFVLPRELDAHRVVDVDFLRREVEARFPRGRVIALEPEPTEGEVRLLGELVAANAELGVVLGVLGRYPEKRSSAVAGALGDGPGPRVGVALHRPIDALGLPATWARLVTYGFGRPALIALLDALAGRSTPAGRLLGLGESAHGAECGPGDGG